MPSDPIEVAAAVLVRGGRMLIARRKAGGLAGYWEFPGGKIEPDETPAACITREIREELSLEISSPEPIIVARHSYPHRSVVLHAFLVREFAGEPKLLDHDALAWVTAPEALTHQLAAADLPVIEEIVRRRLLG